MAAWQKPCESNRTCDASNKQTLFALLWAGLIEFQGFTWWTDQPTGSATLSAAALPAILLALLELAIVAWWEELVFRGYLFQNTVSALGLTGSIVLLSLVFGVLHGMNPNATVLSTVLIAAITPQLVYAYLKTGQLWLPIGIHWGWNFFQGSVFGFAASGQTSPTMIAQSATGPEWLSGDDEGRRASARIGLQGRRGSLGHAGRVLISAMVSSMAAKWMSHRSAWPGQSAGLSEIADWF